MTIQRLLLKQLFNVGIYKYLGEFIFFLSSVVISRLLLPEEFGIIAMATIFYSFLMRFTDLGITESAIREAGDKHFFQGIQNIFLLIGLIAGLVMTILAYPISVFFDQKVLLPIGLTYAAILFLYAFPKAMIAYLRKEEKLVLIAKIELGAVVFQVTGSILLAWTGFSYWSLVLPHLFAPILYYFLYRRYVKLSFKMPSISGTRDTWLKVKSLIYTYSSLNFLQYWEKYVDNLWVGRFYGEVDLGLYNRAYMLMSMPVNLIRGHINGVLYPLVANSSLSAEHIKTEMIRFIKFISAIVTIPAITFILFPVRLSILLWGKNWHGVGEYLGILGISLLILTYNQLSASLYIILRKEKVWLMNGVISGVVSIAFISVGALFSINAMIYGYVLSLLLVSLPVTLYMGYFRSFSFSLREIMDMTGYVYISAIVLVCLKLFSLDEFLIYPSIFVVGISFIRVVYYLKSVSKE